MNAITQNVTQLSEQEIYQFLFWQFLISEFRDITQLRRSQTVDVDPSGKE